MKQTVQTSFSIMAVVAALALAAESQADDAPPAAAPSASGRQQSEGTRRMIERLERIDRDIDIRRAALLTNDKRIKFVSEMLVQTSDLRAKFLGGSELARELLRDGQTEAAIEQFEKVRLIAEQNPQLAAPDFDTTLKAYLAIAYLRLGEQENCLCLRSTDSCLMPIAGSGVHQKKRGSERAAELYTELLEAKPDDMGNRWLLNICYQTLGTYPDAVPTRWLIPPQVFDSEYNIKRFYDVAPDLGLAVNGLAGGCIADDFDNDGYIDIVASKWSLRGQLRYFHNDGDGAFTDRTDEAGLTGLVGGLNLIQTDYNNDGFVDVYVIRGAWLLQEGCHPDSLLRNNGDGTFDDVTEEAGLLSFHPSQTAAWADFDNDGWLDLYVGNESGHPSAAGDAWLAAIGADPEQVANHPCQLFHNNRDGTFTECAEASGVAHRAYVKGVVWGDYNNDGRPDLYVSCLGAPGALYQNDGSPLSAPPASGGDADKAFAWTFTDVSARAGISGPQITFPTWFWDYDNDGWLDLFVAGYKINSLGDIAASYLGLPFNAVRPYLYHNNGNGTFTDVGRQSGLDVAVTPMGANFGDFDNDGWLDFYLGTGDPDFRSLVPNRAFRNDRGMRFQCVTTSGGLGHLQKGHGVSFADIDNDGDQDIYHVLGGSYTGDAAYNVLFLNPGHGNHWLTLRLTGVESNRAAIGARIKVVVETASGPREIHRCVGSGGSFGANSFQEEIGLGDATEIRYVDITWPTTGKTQSLFTVPMDRILAIREGQPEVRAVDLKQIDLTPREIAGEPEPAQQGGEGP